MKKPKKPFKHGGFYLTSIVVSLVLLACALGAIKGLDYILMKYCSHEVESRVESAARTSADRMQTVFDNLESFAGMLAHLSSLSEAQGLNLSSPFYVGALQDSKDHGYGGPVLKKNDYPEIDDALQGEPALGYYPDKGLLFAVPVAYSEENSSLTTFAMYRRYVNRQGRSVFLPSLFENKGLVALYSFGEGELMVANSQALYERLNGNEDLHEALLELNMRGDLSEAQAEHVSTSLGDYFVFSVSVPNSPLILCGAINAEYFSGYFKDLFYAVGIGFCALLLIFNLGLLFLHLGGLKREQALLQTQRKLVERYAYKVTPPILDLVDGQADNPDEAKRRELESKGQEILAKTAQLREETIAHLDLVPPSQHEYTLQELLDLTFEDLKHRDKVKLLLNPNLPEKLYGDPEAISRFFNSFLGLMLRFKPQNLTFQLDGSQPDSKHVNFEVRINTECKALERKLVSGLKQSLQTKTEDLKNLEPHTLGMAIASRIIKDQGGDFSIDALPQGGLILNFSMLQKVLDKGEQQFKYQPLPPETPRSDEVSEVPEVHGSSRIELSPPSPPPAQIPQETEVEFVSSVPKYTKSEPLLQAPPVPQYTKPEPLLQAPPVPQYTKPEPLLQAPPAPKYTQPEPLLQPSPPPQAPAENEPELVAEAAPKTAEPPRRNAFSKMVSHTEMVPKVQRDGPVITQRDFKASGMSYNRPEALKFAAGNQQLYDKFKKMYAEYAQRKLPLIDAAYSNENWDEYIRLLTGISKGAHSIGALRLVTMSKDLIRAAKNLKATVSSGEKDASFIKIHHAEMMDLLADVIVDIER